MRHNLIGDEEDKLLCVGTRKSRKGTGGKREQRCPAWWVPAATAGEVSRDSRKIHSHERPRMSYNKEGR